MITGLGSARSYAAAMRTAHETAAAGAESLITGLGTCGVTGPAVAAVTRARDLTRQAEAAWITAGGALDRQTGVQEAYRAAPDAGGKTFLTETAQAPDTADAAGAPSRSCVFCAIVAGEAPADVVHRWSDVIAFRPRHPVTPGHILVVPHAHVSDLGEQPAVSARTMACAAELAATLPAANVITSKGSVATQTVFHLHLHVVPRQDSDGLPLPWTPQHEEAEARRRREQAAAAPRLAPGTSGVEVVWAREPIPAGPSVFLAGPTPRADSVPSWRPAAIAALSAAWTGAEPLVVLTPESRGGKRATEYHHQVEWEAEGLETVDAVLFWIPRDVATLPGFTTNVEFGLHVRSGRVVLGAPADCPNPERNRYLIWAARRHGVPVLETLDETVRAALDLVASSGRSR